jgi:hypothetical protein
MVARFLAHAVKPGVLWAAREERRMTFDFLQMTGIFKTRDLDPVSGSADSPENSN